MIRSSKRIKDLLLVLANSTNIDISLTTYNKICLNKQTNNKFICEFYKVSIWESSKDNKGNIKQIPKNYEFSSRTAVYCFLAELLPS